jgi:hypothetical protein
MLKLRYLLFALAVLSTTGCLARIVGHGEGERRHGGEARGHEDGNDRGRGNDRGGDRDHKDRKD